MRTFTSTMSDGYPYYWSIERNGASIIIESGRIGGTGGSTRETQTPSFADEATAQAEYDRLVAEKVARVNAKVGSRTEGAGYRELIIPPPEDPACERVFIARWFGERTGRVSRFWTLTQDGTTLSFTWGDLNIGLNGARTETLTFADEAEACRERDKRIARKITEGYGEATETRAAPVASPFSPPHPNSRVRHLIRDGGSSCDLYVRDGSIYSRDAQSRPAIRWHGPDDPGQLARLLKQKKAEGYREGPPSAFQLDPTQLAFETAIEAEPDNMTARMAYADWLMEQPEPVLRARGEFIRTQLALVDESLSGARRENLRRREEQLLERNREDWCGLFADAESEIEFHFDRGWVRAFSIKDTNDEDAVVRLAQALNAWPLARLLTDLELPDDHSVPHLASAAFIPHLRRFKLGEPDRGGGADLAPFLTGAGRLEQLEVYGIRFDMHELFALPFPRLRELTVHGCEVEYPLEVLAANPSLARLEAVRFWPHHLRTRDSAYITAESACALFRSPHLSGLRRIAIYQSESGDEGCGALVESGLLGRLEELDLDMGLISDEGARILAGCPELPRLKRLVLTHNQLTPAGIALLAATGVPLEAGDQWDADAIRDQQHLCGGDFE